MASGSKIGKGKKPGSKKTAAKTRRARIVSQLLRNPSRPGVDAPF